jgi:hypothetical protein
MRLRCVAPGLYAAFSERARRLGQRDRRRGALRGQPAHRERDRVDDLIGIKGLTGNRRHSVSPFLEVHPKCGRQESCLSSFFERRPIA